MFVPRAVFFSKGALPLTDGKPTQQRCHSTVVYYSLLLIIFYYRQQFCRVPLHNKQYLLLDWSLLQHCGSTTSQCGHDKGRQDIQSQVYLRHVFQKYYIWNDAH